MATLAKLLVVTTVVANEVLIMAVVAVLISVLEKMIFTLVLL
nr:MAG TPA: hypothetical protein [Caudoviricetes sp.]